MERCRRVFAFVLLFGLRAGAQVYLDHGCMTLSTESTPFGITTGSTSLQVYVATRLSAAGICAGATLTDISVSPASGSGFYSAPQARMQVGHLSVSPPVPGAWTTHLTNPVTIHDLGQGPYSFTYVPEAQQWSWCSLPGVQGSGFIWDGIRDIGILFTSSSGVTGGFNVQPSTTNLQYFVGVFNAVTQAPAPASAAMNVRLTFQAAPTWQGYSVWSATREMADFVGGNSVANAGDVDADGITDILVGAPQAPQGKGQAKLISGATGTVLLRLTGTSFGELFGSAVAGLGDVNGDGCPDLLIGSPGLGIVRVHSGQNGALLLEVAGSQFEHFGACVAGLGDVNGDSIPDFVAGASQSSLPTGPSASVRSGANGSLIRTLGGPALSVARAGDLNGDGVSEILVGGQGSVHVYSGATGAQLQLFNGWVGSSTYGTPVADAGDVDLDGVRDVIAGCSDGYADVRSGANGTLLLTLIGPYAENFGAAVAGIGDVDGDGRGDLAIGLPGPPWGGGTPANGGIRVFSGGNGALLYSLDGSAAFGRFGCAIAPLGDLDGDGIRDFVAGAPGNCIENPGQAQIISGASGVPIQALSGWDQYGFGSSIARVGDVDGDGASELVVGAAWGCPGIGSAQLLSGANGATLRTWRGTGTGEFLGAAVAGMGDVDGDGVPDIAIGSPGWSYGISQSYGRVQIRSGASGLSILSLLNTSGYGYFGASLAAAGDIDGDGTPDLVVADPGAWSGLAYCGLVHVYSGATGQILRSFPGTTAYDRFGSSLAAGDVDGDGVADIIATSVQVHMGSYCSPKGLGYVKVFSGATGALLRQINGSAVNDWFGSSAMFTGDVDGDGFGDFAIGSVQRGSWCSSYMPGSTGPGFVTLYSGATASPLWTISGCATFDGFGTRISAVGDLDGDGASELLIEAPQQTFNNLAFGYARLVSGSTGTVLLNLQHDGALGFRALGCRLGDVNGDGVPEFAVAGRFPSPYLPSGVSALSLAGQPAGTTLFGSGCAGTGGIAPRISAFGGPPSVTNGNPGFGFVISKGAGGSAAWLFVGSAANPGGTLLGGCPVYLSGEIHALLNGYVLAGPSGAPGGGFRLVPLPIPCMPQFAGASLHLQWALLDAGAPNGLSTSNALTVVLQ